MSQDTVAKKYVILKTNKIEDAFEKETCPYCGKKKTTNHVSKCEIAKVSLEASIGFVRPCWAMHDVCGKVLVISVTQGVALVEGDAGRHTVPYSDLRFNQVASIIQQVEESRLSDDEVLDLINHLRVKAKDLRDIRIHPQLWPGCEVEIQLGKNVEKATIKATHGKGYIAVVQGQNKGIVVHYKHIIRIL